MTLVARSRPRSTVTQSPRTRIESGIGGEKARHHAPVASRRPMDVHAPCQMRGRDTVIPLGRWHHGTQAACQHRLWHLDVEPLLTYVEMCRRLRDAISDRHARVAVGAIRFDGDPETDELLHGNARGCIALAIVVEN